MQIISERNKARFNLLRVILFWFCCMAVFALAVPVARSLSKPWSLIVSVTIAFILTIGLTIVFVRWEKLQLKDVGIVPNANSPFRMFMGFIFGLLLPCLQAVLILLSGHVKLVLSPEISVSAVLLNLLLYFVLSCREELAFRAYPLRSLNYTLGPKIALLFVSIIFGIEHMISNSSWINGFVGPVAGSLLFGVAALKTKGLAFPIGLHAAWNFGQWILGFKGEPGIWKVVIDSVYKDCIDTIGFICYLIVMALGIVSVYFYWKSSSMKDSVVKSEGQNNSYVLVK